VVGRGRTVAESRETWNMVSAHVNDLYTWTARRHMGAGRWPEFRWPQIVILEQTVE
jgi:hypothetical protein